MELLTDILSWAFLVAGSIFAVIGGIGLIRMPDVFTRMHAASVTDTLGAGFLVLGMAFESGFSLATVKLILIIGFIFFTTPTATHALAQAAVSGGGKPEGAEDRRGGAPEG